MTAKKVELEFCSLNFQLIHFVHFLPIPDNNKIIYKINLKRKKKQDRVVCFLKRESKHSQKIFFYNLEKQN